MTRATPASTYDDDFFAWTQEQAAALRRLPSDAGDFDIVHVAEEIEDLGKRDLREVVSYLVRLIEHLLKIDAMPVSVDLAHWISEAGHFQRSAAAAFSPSMRRLLDLAKIWREGCRAAERFFKVVGANVDHPDKCPFTLDELLADDFDLDAALATLTRAGVADRRS